MEEKEKKKILIGSIILVITLILVVVGTTYAFFSLQIKNSSEPTNIEITTGEQNKITLNGGLTNYHIHLKVSDMSLDNVGNSYYGTTEENKDYEIDELSGTQELGNISVSGELADEYVCDAYINMNLDGLMKEQLQEKDLILVVKQGNVTGTYDLSKANNNSNFRFKLNSKIAEPIQTYLKFTNQNTDQSSLAGTDLNITISINDFTCEPNNESQTLKYLHQTTDVNHLKPPYNDDELTRYIGTYEEITNNYICFGTDNKDICLNNKDNYMYHIIGITNENVNTKELELTEGQLKLIKATPVKENGDVKKIQWALSSDREYCETDEVENGKCQWDYVEASETEGPVLQYYLNNTFINTIDSTWQEIISNPKWYKGDLLTRYVERVEEGKISTTKNYKIGLMYASDFWKTWDLEITTNSWLYLTRGTSESSIYAEDEQGVLTEWTMTRHGPYLEAGHYWAWRVGNDGNVVLGFSGVEQLNAIRPVIYLKPNITLTGEGTEDNPFIIHS